MQSSQQPGVLLGLAIADKQTTPAAASRDSNLNVFAASAHPGGSTYSQQKDTAAESGSYDQLGMEGNSTGEWHA